MLLLCVCNATCICVMLLLCVCSWLSCVYLCPCVYCPCVNFHVHNVCASHEYTPTQQSPPTHPTNTGTPPPCGLSQHHLRTMWTYFFHLATTVKHNGVTERSQPALRALAQRCLHHPLPAIHTMPRAFLGQLLAHMHRPGQCQDDVIRRSAGLPFAVVSVLQACMASTQQVCGWVEGGWLICGDGEGGGGECVCDGGVRAWVYGGTCCSTLCFTLLFTYLYTLSHTQYTSPNIHITQYTHHTHNNTQYSSHSAPNRVCFMGVCGS